MREISFHDKKTIERENEDGVLVEEEVAVFIPACCREGWADCPHVVNTDVKKAFNNIGL